MGCISNRYGDMVKRSRLKGWPPPQMTKEEFIEWSLNETPYKELHATWVKKKYQKIYAPSVDRIRVHLPYITTNMQWVTWKFNHYKGVTDDRIPPDDMSGMDDLPY